MMENSKEEKALLSFRSGLNCAQSVLTAYADDFDFDKSLALKLSCGFGAGMGRLQETCGAITGSFMVLGIYNCNKYAENRDKKEGSYSMIEEFSNRFMAIHGTMDCKSLLNCDLKTEEGQQYAKNHKLFETTCEKCISDSIGVLDGLMKEK
jgi:C_GCAxxG_C_C family probable redox protein